MSFLNVGGRSVAKLLVFLICSTSLSAQSEEGSGNAQPHEAEQADAGDAVPRAGPRTEPRTEPQRATFRLADEQWAATLVDHPAARAGDRDAIVADGYELLASNPAHPLAEGTLLFLNAVEAELERPSEARAALLALDPASGFDPVARAQLQLLQGRARLLEAEPMPSVGSELRGFADRAWIVGPVNPARDPLAVLSHSELLLSAPSGLVETVDGSQRGWQELRSSPYASTLQPGDLLDTRIGWVHLTAGVELPGGGPAFFELALSERGGGSAPAAPSKLFHFGGRNFRGWVHGASTAPPSFAWSVDGEPARAVDMGSGEQPSRVLLPVVLRDGTTRLSLRLPAQAASRIGLRVLEADGAPLDDARWTLEVDELGLPVSAEPPRNEPVDTVAHLLSKPTRGPCEDALLGALMLLDRRPARGLHHLERAANAELLGPKALLAGLIDGIVHVPAKSRATRREQLVDEIVASDPDYLPAAVARTERLVIEDRELEAVLRLRELAELHPDQTSSLLVLESLLRQLALNFEADEVLGQAELRAPSAPLVLLHRAEHSQRRGRTRLAFEQRMRAQREEGWTVPSLIQLAQSATGIGLLDMAHSLWDAALTREPLRSRQLRHVRWLSGVGEVERAQAVLDTLANVGTHGSSFEIAQADLLRLAGDDAEWLWLLAAMEVEPGRPELRRRLSEHVPDFVDPALAGARAWLVDTETALAAYDAAAQSDSVVKLLDQAYVHVFEDGTLETITHDLLQLRDLEGVDRHGERGPPGDILSLATLKPDGRRLEPVLVGNSYVMPQLQPGDFIEQISRTSSYVPPGYPRRPGGWFFQSTAMPFLRSRYVVSLPKNSELQLVTKRFEGTHTVEDLGDREVHTFEQLHAPRLIREPGAPPNDWILPMIEFGQDADLSAELHRQRVVLRAATEPTPAIRSKVRELLEGQGSQRDAAVTLYEFAQEHVTQARGEVTPAHATLVSGEGNAALLFASLLRAAAIPHDLIWSRDITPEADEEPEPVFATVGRLTRRLYVLVEPADGRAVMCDPGVRLLPYGQLPGGAPGAEAMRVGTGEFLRMPSGEGDDMPGQRIQLGYTVHADGSAEVEGLITMLGQGGFTLKQQLRDLPQSNRTALVGQTAAAFAPGIDLEEGRVTGLDVEGQRVGFAFSGHVPLFLDRDDASGQRLARPLPIPPLQLAASFASEGERRLPFRSTAYGRIEVNVDISLDPGLSDAVELDSLNLDFEGLRYSFSVSRPEPRALRLRRRFETRPYVISAAQHAGLLSVAERIDELEQGRLEFSVDS